MTDYLLSAKTVLDCDAPSPHDLGLADTHSLISIAESLAVLASQPNAIEIINSRLRGIENDLDELDECLHKHLPKDAEHISAAGESDLSHAQAESVPVTPEDSEAAERRLVKEMARAIWVSDYGPDMDGILTDHGPHRQSQAQKVLAALRETYTIQPREGV